MMMDDSMMMHAGLKGLVIETPCRKFAVDDVPGV
jgi:hypothetical protein